jgi:hypothetical protein
MEDLAGSVVAPLTLTIEDKTAPTVGLSGRSPQPVAQRRAVVVHASCSEACSLHGSGRIVVPGRATIRLRTARATLAGAGKTTLRLRITATAQKQLRELLSNGRRGRATVAVRAVDRFGNARTVRRTFAVIASGGGAR